MCDRRVVPEVCTRGGIERAGAGVLGVLWAGGGGRGGCAVGNGGVARRVSARSVCVGAGEGVHKRDQKCDVMPIEGGVGRC